MVEEMETARNGRGATECKKRRNGEPRKTREEGKMREGKTTIRGIYVRERRESDPLG
jgi:hypothetical protein